MSGTVFSSERRLFFLIPRSATKQKRNGNNKSDHFLQCTFVMFKSLPYDAESSRPLLINSFGRQGDVRKIKAMDLTKSIVEHLQ